MNLTRCLLVAGLALPAAGCTWLKPQPVGEVLTQKEPDTGNDYLLYRPSNYNDGRSWPLVVLCHASPWQTPRSVLLDWAEIAEDQGLLLVVPELESTSEWTPSPKQQLKRQEQDEQRLLQSIRHVRGSCRVADDRMFIAGTGAGCRAALYTGLRNPDVFRMVALLQPRFDVRHVTRVKEFVDPFQRVLVLERFGDLYQQQTRDCLEWLWDQRLDVDERRSGAALDRLPDIAYEAIKNTVRRSPWVRVQAFETTDPMRVRFAVQTSLDEVHKYEWDFGDGGTDVVARPEHAYGDPGSYRVTLKLYPRPNQPLQRSIVITVPPGYIPPDETLP